MSRRRKKFKNTAVGKILIGAVKIANPTLGQVLDGAGNVGQALDAIKASSLPPEKKLEFEKLIFEAEVMDRDSARKAEIERLKAGGNNDLMDTIGWGALIAYIGFLIALFTLEIPEDKEQIVNIAFGSVQGVFLMVASYFFGSAHKK